MPKENRRYRKRSRSGSRSSSSSEGRDRKRSRSRSPVERMRRSRSKDRIRRSRSRERRRSRSRERDRRRFFPMMVERRRRSPSPPRSRIRRSRSRERRSRSRGRDGDKADEKKKNEVKESKTKDDVEEDKFEPSQHDKEAEVKRLEMEMQKRRDRIEKWRADRRKKDQEEIIASGQLVILPPTKKWTLEDDDDEDLPVDNGELGPVEDEVDPLDAFMQGVQEEVRQIRKLDVRKGGGKPPPPVVGTPAPEAEKSPLVSGYVSGFAKKKEEKKKGELIEQDQDALEYSSEEEGEDLQTTMSGLQNKQKKLLQAVDHTQITYLPFRKNFYVEVPEMARMTNDEVELYRTELEGIRIKGKGCPKPIKSWAQCGASRKILDVLKKHNYEKPTPIQAQAIPVVMVGRDMIGIAKTGSGKTLAFLIPMFRHILDQPALEADEGPIAIIMTPTRELAMQIGKESRKFTKSLNLHAVCVYGGTGISEQIAELKRGAEIIVCTPGRMIDMLAANSGRVTNLKRCTYVVLDEADRMFDMGFEPQVMRILDNVRPDRQTVMFSATFPRQMEALARRALTKPIEVQVGGRSVVCKEVEQHVIVIEEDQKFLKLLELLGFYQDQGSILVFVDKQEHADMLLKDLMKASYPCMSLHGGIDQFDRDSTMVDFKSGKVKLLIATSVAARGLDVKQLMLVVNYDCPNHYEDYVHRCGRTGRAGNKGSAYTFITPEQYRYSVDIIKALKLTNNPVPPELQALNDAYEIKQQMEGKKAKGGSGFSGKGYKFDEAEAQLANERKKFQKAALGLQDSDEDDGEDDIDQQIESIMAPKRMVKEVTAPVNGPQVSGAAGPVMPSGSNVEKLELAKRLASRINIAKNLGAEAKGMTQQVTEAIMKGEMAQPIISVRAKAKTMAEQLAEKLNAKLNYQPKSDEEAKEEEAQVETFKKYEEELEINDFPQQARWRVTSKEALAQISEYSEAGITVRGTYYPNAKDAKDGDRKLYLAIESTNELAVSKAKAEITRLIKEELIKLQTSYHPANRGRYKVL